MQVKNKPCVRFTSIVRLISWIRPHGSETGQSACRHPRKIAAEIVKIYVKQGEDIVSRITYRAKAVTFEVSKHLLILIQLAAS